MRFAGSPSWLLSTSVDAMPHTALYIRDALGLDTSADDVSPPPLSHRPPDRRKLLSESERSRASSQWLPWWQAILTQESVLHGTTNTADFQAWYARFAAERARTVGDPPEFDALMGSPELRRAVIDLDPEAHSYRDHTRSADAGEPTIPWTIARDAAEDVALRHGVSVGEVRGVVLILGVEGVWSRILQPGVMICSDACLADTAISTRLVREVFESALP
ncbi:hypothetical protein [Pengzhenrongella sp.]|jgi:hypothetical protein|uniref:hypothetical protein n=1 Tax=Pengzhenrongella sp. TaxID=2888820 RepID=UPI002F9365EE